MAETGETGNRETQKQNVAVQIPNISRDLLQRFAWSNYFSLRNPEFCEEECEKEEIELSLGLSMNGRFGVDRNKLTRSSSIPEGFMNKLKAKIQDNEETSCLVPSASPSLFRTSSLPVETEEEWRKRKELQSLKRMEAKRKRLKKMRVVEEFHTAAGEEGLFALENNNEEQGTRNYCFAPGWVDEKLESIGGGKERSGIRNVNFAPPAINWGGGCRVEARGGKGNLLPSGSSNGSSQGSSGGSSVSNPIKIHQNQDPSKNSDSSPEAEQKQARIRHVEKNPLVDSEGSTGLEVLRGKMPSVSTRGNGPNGKRVEGLLYGYRKGEEVRIVCVCHGSFLSPAEFVKHAGGDDSLNPLKHIVVDPTSIF